MPRLQIELDAATTEALSSIAGARGTTPADLVAEIVGKYVHVPAQDLQPDPLDALVGSIDADPDDGYRAPPDAMDELVGKYTTGRFQGNPPDPLDAIVGSIDAEPVDDIDEVIYGR
jgi:hypothetical protein